MTFNNFSIRLLSTEDYSSFFNLIESNRPRLEAFFSVTVSKTRTLEDTQKYVTENLGKIEQKTYLPFLLINSHNNSLIGFVDIKNIDWNIPKGELGYFIDEHYSNKGMSKKFLTCFTNFCFENYGFKKLFLRTHETNHAAKKLAENCGFEIEGIIRRDYKTTTGELIDLLYYGKLSSN